ncbi:hypothetical protein BIFGAL_03994 [Bifidobacterium gallicum DSM 20093 = LMG 11596]|uniref:Uncharacterized protein n=1 Tax=Bifidobacterium gallicum DSM 20093 = LMG 11596 TaxID=561180 RepID=D1NVU9_9BIFI|nr:hypothetical protein BIFGAL_03994 [Bifidobacterium gallicum DSM 20093 = LMG 11596]
MAFAMMTLLELWNRGWLRWGVCLVGNCWSAALPHRPRTMQHHAASCAGVPGVPRGWWRDAVPSNCTLRLLL